MLVASWAWTFCFVCGILWCFAAAFKSQLIIASDIDFLFCLGCLQYFVAVAF